MTKEVNSAITLNLFSCPISLFITRESGVLFELFFMYIFDVYISFKN